MGDEPHSLVIAAEGDWWLQHIGEMAEHYRRLYERHETRARYVLLLAGFGIAAVKFALELDASPVHLVLKVALGILLVALIVSCCLLLSVMTPLRGSKFFRWSLADVVHRLATSNIAQSAPVIPFIGVKDIAKMRPFDLSGEFSEASKAGLRSVEARDVLANYLRGEFRTDLTWWLRGTDNTPIGDRIFDIRRRQVFWYWANKEAANKKAVVLEISISIVIIVTLLFLLFWTGYRFALMVG